MPKRHSYVDFVTMALEVRAKHNIVDEMIKGKASALVLGLSVFTALIYNSWPLAYWLNPSGLKNNYLSVLEVVGRPYAWVFILADALTAIAVVICGLIVIKLKPISRHRLIGFIIFGAATLIEAITPISNRCGESISACGISPVQILSLHDIASTIAALGLLHSLLISLRHFRGDKNNLKLYNWFLPIFWLWSFSGIFLVVSVALDQATLISQASFLVACGIAIVALPLSALIAKEGSPSSHQTQPKFFGRVGNSSPKLQ